MSAAIGHIAKALVKLESEHSDLRECLHAHQALKAHHAHHPMGPAKFSGIQGHLVYL